MSNFYEKYQSMIDDFINNNLIYIENYCRINYIINKYIEYNINHKIDIQCFIENIPNNLKDNYNFFIDAVMYNGYYLEYASDDLKNNYNIALNAVLHDYNYKVILYLPSKFIKNRKLIVNMNNSNHNQYYYRRDIIIKIMDYKFEIKENKLLKQNLNSIFIFF